MSKNVQMSIKMESELRDQFMALSAAMHRPAAQIIRELMRAYLTQKEETPNSETISAIKAIERGEVTSYANTEDLYKALGI